MFIFIFTYFESVNISCTLRDYEETYLFKFDIYLGQPSHCPEKQNKSEFSQISSYKAEMLLLMNCNDICL